jgi:3-phosphoshikimate 1-carboxyvinyltransferase
MNVTVYPKKYAGTIAIPASKSDTQRALLAASFAKGKSILRNLGCSEDDEAMLSSIQQLGATVYKNITNEIEVIGIDQFPSNITLQCGESGLGSRLLIALCACHSGEFKITGEGSLLKRSMSFYLDLFNENSIQATFTNQSFLPLSFNGGLKPGEFIVDGSQSSQYISGLLMGLPLLKGDSKLIVQNLTSTPYVDMTVQTLKQFGIQIERAANEIFLIKGNQEYQPVDYTIESDWSSASFWLVASALGQDIRVSGLSLESLQADRKIIDILISADCKINVENGLITIDGTNRKAFEADLTHCPDLFPIMTIFALFCKGTTTLYGVERLVNKESNRGEVLQEELSKLGVQIQLKENTMVIEGVEEISGGTISSNNDHRIAMAFAILGMFSKSPITIESAEAVSKSYPNFWEELNGLSS